MEVVQDDAHVGRPERSISTIVDQATPAVDAGQDRVGAGGSRRALPGRDTIRRRPGSCSPTRPATSPSSRRARHSLPDGVSREIVVDEAPRADPADDAQGADVIRVGDRSGNGERSAT